MCQICLKFATFAENKLRLANRKSPFFALACIILAENKLRLANRKSPFFALACIILAENKLRSASKGLFTLCFVKLI